VVQRRAHLIGCEADASVEHRRTLRDGHGEVALGDSDLGLLCGAQNGKVQSQGEDRGGQQSLGGSCRVLAVSLTVAFGVARRRRADLARLASSHI
jgi:hypothetical protein